MDRLRPRPVDDAGSNAVGRNAEHHKEIYRRSDATTFLTGYVRSIFLKTRSRPLDRLRPRPVDDTGSNSVGRNAEHHKEIYRRSEATTFLTGYVHSIFLKARNRPLSLSGL